uniref:Uncharacterized protein n=1 Tax=Biomphalaria glabrata TaxID=6526 RepID=A0A2C9JJP6_BIOGL
MNVQVIYPLVAVTLLEIIIFVRVSSHGNRWSLCDKVDQLKQGAGLRSMAVNQCITSDQERAAQPMTKCRDPGSMVQVTTESMGSRIKATISACPNVLKVLVYVDAPGYFERGAAANEKTISCFRPHSTLLVQQPMKRVKVTLVRAEQPSDTIFKLKICGILINTLVLSSWFELLLDSSVIDQLQEVNSWTATEQKEEP